MYSPVYLLIHWAVSALALMVTSAIVPGIRVRGFVTALIATFVLGLLNYSLWPILVVLTIPFTILTFGLFLFVLDAIILRVCAAFLKNFEISGWLSAILGAFILSLVSNFLHWMLA